ncbi:MAG: SCO family protein [Burkholderiales bacterium]|nr:SCO family protein [Burkholderiales bacterium]
MNRRSAIGLIAHYALLTGAAGLIAACSPQQAAFTTMTELAGVKQALGKDGDRLQVLFVSVDPERDTPAVLKGYMANFDPSFLALYAPPDKLVELAKEYKIYYKKVEGKSDSSYTMDHSAGSYVYDTKGQLRLFTRYGSDPKGLTEDVRILLKQAS